ncbi:MAG: sulfite exporter TauE/SafE family protein [Lentisphaerae bacterium]|jgi:sulfite exporter TauE/SafE|nr:sulfite exporter TauE/SafE family protein [Lentisphaerota bacterium]
MTRTLVIDAFLAGLSTGVVCGMTCLPVLAPVFAAEARGTRASWAALLQVLGGRLAGYLLFGALAGWLGQRVGSPAFLLLATIGMMLMAVWLLVYAAGFLQTRPPCARPTRRGRVTPALLGFLLSARVCPPLLMSLAYVFTLQNVTAGLLYFLVFFLATSLYFLPLPFIGWLGRFRELRLAARVSATLVGILFLVHGGIMLSRLL